MWICWYWRENSEQNSLKWLICVRVSGSLLCTLWCNTLACILLCISRTLLSVPTVCKFQSHFFLTQQWSDMRLHQLEYNLHPIWTGVDVKQCILHYFQSLTEENPFDPTYCSHWQLHCQSGWGGKKNLPCWKQVKWKKPTIIHLMAFIVIVLTAFIWILFQMLAGTETSQGNNPDVLFYCESCFCCGLMCDSCY